MPSAPVPIPKKPVPEEVRGPGSQYCGSVFCGSPQRITTVTSTGQVVETWGVPPKPGEETCSIPRRGPPKPRTDQKK